MRYSKLTENEKLVQLLIVAGTNAFGLPCAVRCARNACFFEMWMGLGALFVSVMYHSAEALRQPLWGMTDGQWHRLDNVFAIMCFVSLMLFLMDNQSAKVDECLRWGFVVLVTWAQEKGPWVLYYTIMPIVLSALLLLGKYVLVKRAMPRYFKSPSERGIVRNAVLTMLVAFFFFYKGLNESQDYLRIYHGLWHLFSSLSFYQFFALDVSSKRRVRVAAREEKDAGAAHSASE